MERTKKDWSEVAPYFAGDAVVHLATLEPDGSPHAVPVWVDVHGDGDLVFFSEAGSKKDRNVTRDPRVAFSVTTPDNPLDMATVRGEVIERVEGERGMEIVDRISQAYTGGGYEVRTGLVAFVVRPRTWWARNYAG